MKASSLQTILFSVIFACLLMFTSASTTTSLEEDVASSIDQQMSQDEYVTPEYVDPSNNFWPPVHLRGLRSSSNGKPTFIRFGKRGSPSFIRFGRK